MVVPHGLNAVSCSFLIFSNIVKNTCYPVLIISEKIRFTFHYKNFSWCRGRWTSPFRGLLITIVLWILKTNILFHSRLRQNDFRNSVVNCRIDRVYVGRYIGFLKYKQSFQHNEAIISKTIRNLDVSRSLFYHFLQINTWIFCKSLLHS